MKRRVAVASSIAVAVAFAISTEPASADKPASLPQPAIDAITNNFFGALVNGDPEIVKKFPYLP